MKRTILILGVLTGLNGLAACNESQPKKDDAPSELSQQGSMGRGQGPVRAACDAEIKRLCTAEERTGKCLRAHENELSEGCKAALATRGQQR